MRLHIVGGFLGSGKTTAIGAAARLLARQGVKVGVVTNDQGKNLVDTLFMDLQGTPTTEVTGGCFCCQFSDFSTKLAELASSEKPEVIFAEAVGSCADVVATVVSPITNAMHGDYLEALGFSGSPTFSVFCDARILDRRLSGETLPFSEDLLYLFDKQLDEAGLMVVNKSDLVQDLAALAHKLEQRYPGKPWRFQSSLRDADILAWVDSLERSDAEFSGHPERVDYDRYGAAEASLAWADLVVDLHCGDPSKNLGALAIDFLRGLVLRVENGIGPIGHAKAYLGGIGSIGGIGNTKMGATKEGAKISLVPAGNPYEIDLVPPFSGDLQLTVNIRAQGNPLAMQAIIETALDDFMRWQRLQGTVKAFNVFSPNPPSPPPQRIAQP